MINKQSWQYKGLVQWWPMIAIDRERRRELISGKFIEDDFSNPDIDYIVTPLGKSLPVFNHTASRFDSGSDEPKFNVIAQNQFTVSFWYKAAYFNYYIIYANDLLSVQIGSEYGSDRCFLRVNGNIFGAINDSTVSDAEFYNNKWNNIVITVKNGLAKGFFNGRFTREDAAYHQFNSRIYSSIYGGYGGQNCNIFDFRLYNYAWSDAQALKYCSNIRERNALYTPHHLITDSVFTLNNSLTFHTINSETINDSTDLFIEGIPVPQSGNVELFTKGAEFINNSVELYTSGTKIIVNDSIDLHTWGGLTDSSGVDLHTWGKEDITNSTTLHTWGSLPINSGITLYMRSDLPMSGNLDMFVDGKYIEREELILYVEGEGYPESGNVSLFTYASESGTYSLYNTASLAVINSQTMDPRHELKLFVQGSPETLVTAVNLVAYNNTDLNLSMPLYIDGPTTSFSGLPLYITTETGVYPEGSIQTNSSLLLFLNREKEALEKSTSLFVKAKEPSVESCDLMIEGYTYSTNSLTFVVEGSGIPENTINSSTMYVRGGI